MAGMRYLLDRHYRLRGWLHAPTGLYDARRKVAEFLPLDDYEMLMRCDGAHDLEPENLDEEGQRLFHELQERGVIRKAWLGEYLAPEQEYRVYPAQYKREAHWSITGSCGLPAFPSARGSGP